MLGFIAVLTFIYGKKGKISFVKTGILFCFISGILGGPIGMLCYLHSIELIGEVKASSLSITYPIFRAIISFLFLNNKLSFTEILGFLISIFCLGLLLTIDSSSTEYSFKQTSIIRISLALITAFSWGSEIISSSYAMKYYSGTQIYLFRQLFSSMGYFIVIMFLSQNDKFHFSFTNYEIIIGIILSSILSYFLYYQAIYTIKPIKAMALNITYGIWILIFSILLFNKSINFIDIILCIGMLIGTLLVIFSNKKQNTTI